MSIKKELYTYTYLDGNGNQILVNNNVNSVCYYSSSDETWDKTGGGCASWYIENNTPNDIFLGPNLADNIWDYFNFRGTVSGIVDQGLHLSISGSDSRGGVTSYSTWKLSGDFDIKAYVDEDSYYNEYRGSSAVGVSVSVDDSYKYRVSKFFDGEKIVYKNHYVENSNLKYYGWFDIGEEIDTINTGTTCFRIKRDGDVIRSYIGNNGVFSQVGTYVSGTMWSDDVYVSLELETEQENTLRTTFDGFTVSGTIVPSGTYPSAYRGVQKEFPDSALILTDDYGMSIINEIDMSLWMRFKYSPDLFVSENSPIISANNGNIYFTTSSGLHCVDFVNDKLKKYTKDYTSESLGGVSSRNVVNSYNLLPESGFILDNRIVGVSAKNIDNNSFVAVATTSGVGLLVNDVGKKCFTTIGTKAVRLFDSGYLAWNENSGNSDIGFLSIRENISNLVNDLSPTFSRSFYYDTTTTPALSSVDINNVYIQNDGVLRLVACNDFGLDYIDNSVVTYFGPESVDNPVLDGEFNNYIGINWVRNPSVIGFNQFDIFRTSEWSTSSYGYSLCLSMISNRYTFDGDYDEVYQQVDLTNTGFVLYDIKFIKPTGWAGGYVSLDVLIDDTVIASYDDVISKEYFGMVLDLHQYVGIHTLRFRINSHYSGQCALETYGGLDDYRFYVSNIRTNDVSLFSSIIPTSSSEFLDAYILYTSTERKLFFSTRSGYGSIDVDTKTLDFFNEIGDYLPLSSVLSVCFEEEVSLGS